MRAYLPRFAGDNGIKNQQLVARLQQIATGLGATPSQLAIAWVIARGRTLGLDMVALVGARTRVQLDKSLGAWRLALGDDDRQRIEAALAADAVAGTRYDTFQMGHLDSEK